MTKTQQIADSLLERIQRRQLCGRIPSGKVIAEEYHVALMTAVNALKILEKKGYVIRIPRKGTFTAEPQQKTLKIFCNKNPSPFFAVVSELVHKWDPEYELVKANNAEEADLIQWTTLSGLLKSHIDVFPLSKERETRLRQQKHFWSQLFDLHCRNGLLCGVPYMFSPVLLNYNRKIMRELEKDFSAADLTMEHFITLLRLASERGYHGIDLSSFAIMFFLAVANALADGTPDSGALLKAARYLKEIKKYSGGSFAEGKTLFTLAPRNNYFHDKFSDYDISPLPAVNGVRCNPAASGTLVVSSQASIPERLHDLCELLLSEESQRKLTVEKFGIAMDRSVAMDSMDSSGRRDDFYFSEVKNIRLSHYDYEPDTLQEIALLVIDFQDDVIGFDDFESGLLKAMKDQFRAQQRRKRFLRLNDFDHKPHQGY